jgi:hypothetical protein
VTGALSTTPDTLHPFGPYLQAVPVNPISGSSTVTVINSGSTAFAAPTADGGWWFNMVTGEFRADLKDSWTKADGTILNTL